MILWNRYLKPLAGKPIHYLEVGLFEGRSMVWMLENVLTDDEATATGIDVIIYPRYMENLVRTGACDKVRNLRGRSQDLLHTLPKVAST
jgi:predicted O-methyltransferase YrrM